MHPSLVAMLTDTFLHEAFTGHDGYGTPTYAASVARKGRMETHIVTAMTATGPQRLQETRVFFDPADGMIDQRDRLTFPDGAQPRIQGVGAPPDDQAGRAYLEVQF